MSDIRAPAAAGAAGGGDGSTVVVPLPGFRFRDPTPLRRPTLKFGDVEMLAYSAACRKNEIDLSMVWPVMPDSRIHSSSCARVAFRLLRTSGSA